MVSVCSGKEALAEVVGLSDVAEKIPVPLRTNSSGQGRGQHLRFLFYIPPRSFSAVVKYRLSLCATPPWMAMRLSEVIL